MSKYNCLYLKLKFYNNWSRESYFITVCTLKIGTRKKNDKFTTSFYLVFYFWHSKYHIDFLLKIKFHL